jgi:hypothetical protein
MAAYRYYVRSSPVERTKSVIAPAVAEMSRAGEFVEYSAQDAESLPPPVTDGSSVVYSVSDKSDNPGFRRLSYFYPSDYPDICQEGAVKQERSLEAYVLIYELINGSDTETTNVIGEADR